jgi:hypothetical protein
MTGRDGIISIGQGGSCFGLLFRAAVIGFSSVAALPSQRADELRDFSAAEMAAGSGYYSSPQM